MFNASLIICTPPSKRNKKRLKSRSIILQSSKKKKTVPSLKYKYKKSLCYDNSLKFIRQSNNMRLKRRSRNKAIQSLEKNVHTIDFTNSQSTQSDSVIILSDSENDEDKPNTRNHERVAQKAVKITTESLCTSPGKMLKAIQHWRKNNKHSDISKNPTDIKKNKQKENCMKSVDNNTSLSIMSDNENVEYSLKNINRENIEPSKSLLNQSSDDIIMVWSSTENNDQQKQNFNQKEDEKIFMIDRHRNLDNLECLQSELEQQPKKFKEISKKKKLKPTDKKLPFSTPGLMLPACKNIIPSSKISNFKEKQKLNSKNDAKVNTNEISKKYSRGTLREIVIDGCNVAMAHSNGRTFSEVGLKLVIDYFKERGHTVKVFVPQHKRSYNHPLLEKLYLDGTVIFTPSRNIAGKSITPYDDRYILKYATVCKGIVVSLDQYRDLYLEKLEWRETIEKRLLAPTFVGDYVMFPEDPLGRDGPTLDEFLRH